MKNLITKSKYLSKILRHDPSCGGISLTKDGWAYISDLIHHSGFTRSEIELIVETDKKQRYCFDNTKQKIRANQGHSIDVDIEFKKVNPPKYLYHGTIQKNIDSIFEIGLKPGKRKYVHLSPDMETASNVGSRRGTPVILKIKADEMYNDGFDIFLSENGVYLIEYVPVKYISNDIIRISNEYKYNT